MRLKKTPLTLASSAPEASSAAMVLAKVGASGLPRIAAISCFCWAMPAWNAGR